MKKLSRFWLAGLLLLGVCACSDDGMSDGKGNNLELDDVVYVQFKLELPVGSRSATNTPDDGDYVTSEDGTEIGKNYENKVNNVLVALCDDDGMFASGYVQSPQAIHDDLYIVPFKSAQLEDKEDAKITVYVYCNSLASISNNSLDLDMIYNLATDSETAAIWNKSGSNFYMSNAKKHTATLPLDFAVHNTESNPIDLGTVEVERSVARFDYKQSSNVDVFPLMVDKDDETKTLVQVQFTHAALINMSKNFYYLRRISNQADGYTKPVICGVETSTNYVVDTDAEDKAKYAGGDEELVGNFHYSLSDPSSWKFKPLSEIVAADEDEDEEWNENEDKGDYHIWRYVTENTIPSISKQMNGITTGVVFKAEIQLTSNVATTDELYLSFNGRGENGADKSQKVYVFGNVLYGDWTAVEKAAGKTDKGTYDETLLGIACEAVNQVRAKTGGATNAEITAAEAKAGFTSYVRSSDGKFYAYYYYWNRHNDNNDNSDMGPMEFCVVRNNVYKLNIKSVLKFGHPDPVDPDDPDGPTPTDPDPVDPEDPDEDENVYFKVAVKVLPWVVRINEIEF